MNWLRKLFKKKKTLRDKVVEMYGNKLEHTMIKLVKVFQ